MTDQPRADEPAPARDDEPRPGKLRLSLAMLGFAAVGLVIPIVAIAIGYRSCIGSTVRAQLSITGDGVAWTWRPQGCDAEADGRTIALTTESQRAVRVTLDPIDGPRVELSPPDQPLLVLDPATCPGLLVRMRVDGKRDDGSAILAGSATARCPVPPGHPWAGAQIELDAWWKGCKLPEP